MYPIKDTPTTTVQAIAEIAPNDEITISYDANGYYYEGDCRCMECTGNATTTLLPPEATRKRRLERDERSKAVTEGKKKKTKRGGMAWRNEMKAKDTDAT